MNIRKFNAARALNDDKLSDLSMFLNRTIASLTMKSTRFPRYKFDQVEIGKLIARWNLTPQEVVEIFFDGQEVDGEKWGYYGE